MFSLAQTDSPSSPALQKLQIEGQHLRWFIAFQCDTMHYAFEPLIVIHWIVLCAAIIPESKGSWSPAKTVGKL